MRTYVFGVDIGGTKIAVSLGVRSGRIIKKEIFSSLQGKYPSRSIEAIAHAILSLQSEFKIDRKQILGVGLAVAGAIDSKRGMILKSPHLRAWQRVKLRAQIEKKCGFPVYIENDANAASLGERYFGLGRRRENFLYITVSTGIGSGIIANGQLIRGTAGFAGEIGHLTIVPGGQKCGCGKRGCLEAYGSGTAIAREARRFFRKGHRSRFWKNVSIGHVSGKKVSEGAERGDPFSFRVRRKMADYLGIGLANVINVLNPELIVLGGGVMEYTKDFWPFMMKAVKREAWPDSFKSCRIVKSRLGPRVGDLGAIALVLDRMKDHLSCNR